MENLIYNKFSKEYDQLFFGQIINFGKNAKDEEAKEYVSFYPSFGVQQNEQCDFIVYGQAVNGWGDQFNINEAEESIRERIKKSIEFSNAFYSEKKHSPLDWVNVYWSKSAYKSFAVTPEEFNFYEPISYQTCRSFFWNVTYKVISKYYKLDLNSGDWAKKIIWSNLYKIAPPKGNPSYKTQLHQQQYAIELVKREIEEIKPKYCIVLTNESWWEPFRKGLNTKILHHEGGREVISIEEYNGTLIILTTRPFRGNNDNHVEQILKAISYQPMNNNQLP